MPYRICAFQLSSGCLLPAMIAAVFLAAACNSKPGSAPTPPPVAADTWAIVNGKEIKQADVDRAYRRMQDAETPLSAEETLTAKLNLLNDLVVQELLFEKAKALNIDIPAADLDTAYGNAKKNISDEAYQQELAKRNLTADDMREGLRRELLTQKVLEKEVSEKATVSDQEVADFFAANRAQFNLAEEAYRIAQIVVTPVREPQITNGTGDDATTPEAANAKTQMLLERLKAGADFAQLAAGYSEDAESAPRGGELGYLPISRLKQAPAQLRNAVLNKEAGSVSVASVGASHTLVLVIAHEMPGQRDLTTPGVKDSITNTLKGRKEQLLRAAYLNAVRNDASVTNYLAKRVVEGNGKLPGDVK